MDIEELAREAVDVGFRIHKELGPGLFESVYETLMANSLERRGVRVARQMPIPLEYDGVKFEEAFRAYLLLNDLLLIEIKSTEKYANVHSKQLLTYLRIMKRPLGLLMNFGHGTFREGVQRVVNNHNRPE